MAVAPEVRVEERLEPAAGDQAEQLFRRHAGWIRRHCLRRLGSPEEADDALMATYLNACRSLQEGLTPRVESAWLFRIAENVCRTRLRSSGRRARIERVQDVGLLEETAAAPERPTDELIGLDEALAALPGRQRRALVLREWRGLSYREVGAELSLSQGAVETLLFRARRSLATALERPERRRNGVLHGFGLPGLLASAKSFLFGSAGVGVKVATVAAVASTTVVVAADPVGWHRTAVEEKAPPPSLAKSQPAAVGAAGAASAVAAQPPRPTRVERVTHLADPPVRAPAAARQTAPPDDAPAAAKASVSEAPPPPAKEATGTAGPEHVPEGKSHGSKKDERPETAAVQQGRPEKPPSPRGQGRDSSSRPAFAGSQGPPPHAQGKPEKKAEPKQKAEPREKKDPAGRRSSARLDDSPT